MLELSAAGKHALGVTSPPQGLSLWVTRTRAAMRPVMRPYLDLCRVPRWAPDFLTPAGAGADFTADLERILATPAAELSAELGPRIDSGDLPSRVAPLAAGQPEAVLQLGVAMSAFHAVAIAPYWKEISAATYADRAARGSAIVDVGIERVLSSLSPHLRWRASALSYDCPGGADIDIEAGGRGVILVPSYLKPQPSFLDVAGAPVEIAYPIQRPRQELMSREPLVVLFGRTRAAVLAAVESGRSTSQLAEAVGVSISSASQHAAVLRAAGLVATHRTGTSVRHSLTPIGSSLLRGAGAVQSDSG